MGCVSRVNFLIFISNTVSYFIIIYIIYKSLSFLHLLDFFSPLYSYFLIFFNITYLWLFRRVPVLTPPLRAALFFFF